MNKTPKALRLHIAVAGRTNTGKSSFLNYITGQKVSITSSVPGTTTDIVEKAVEFLPLGPVVFLDTAGLEDFSELGAVRMNRTNEALKRSDIIILIVEPDIWGNAEESIAVYAKENELPLLIVVNKIDLTGVTKVFQKKMVDFTPFIIACSTKNAKKRESIISKVKNVLIKNAPDDYLNPPSLIGDLISAGGHAVLLIPIDTQAPKGRLILPQVQTLRALLDNNSTGTVVKETEYPKLIQDRLLTTDLVICDSQVVDLMVKETPDNIPVTTFSILFARYKGDFNAFTKGAAAINRLKEGDCILISEACSHHPLEDDIGRIKIPKWIEAYRDCCFNWDIVSGKDYPENLETYSLIIHCGGCMLNRRGMLSRIEQAAAAGIPITNYGLAISVAHGHFDRVVAPFHMD